MDVLEAATRLLIRRSHDDEMLNQIYDRNVGTICVKLGGGETERDRRTRWFTLPRGVERLERDTAETISAEEENLVRARPLGRQAAALGGSRPSGLDKQAWTCPDRVHSGKSREETSNPKSDRVALSPDIDPSSRLHPSRWRAKQCPTRRSLPAGDQNGASQFGLAR